MSDAEAKKPLLLSSSQPSAPALRGTPTDVTPYMKLVAAIALLPIVDFFTDIALLNVLLDAGWTGWALVVLTVGVLHLRFLSLYAALSPAPELSNFILMYIPFLALPYFNEISGHATGDIVNDLYEKAGLLNSAGAAPASPRSGPSRRSRAINRRTATLCGNWTRPSTEFPVCRGRPGGTRCRRKRGRRSRWAGERAS